MIVLFSHRSMLDYLFQAGLSETYEALKQEARLVRLGR